MGPGKKTPRRMNGDTREWSIVQAGTLRFTVEGREPLVATKGVMVQVPYRTLYRNRERRRRAGAPLRGERRARPQALSDGRDPGAAARLRIRPDARHRRDAASLDARNRPVVDFNKVVSGEERGGAFVSDNRGFANIIMGRYQPPQPGNKGHYHEEGGELADHARHHPLQDRGARPSSRPRKATSSPPAADVAPGEQRRPGRPALVPPGDERVPVSRRTCSTRTELK